uniref:Uncharacterized protein n=1 Tax=Avena sativa TaxID=4498 RepID=A0ACD5YFN0_AVESA
MVGAPPPATPQAAAATRSLSEGGTSRRARSPSRGRSRARRGNGGEMVIREIVREGGGGGGSATYPTLTRTNYQEWTILMRIALQGAGLWEAVDTGDATERAERQALGAILRSVPPEMVPALAVKDDAKVAWDTLKAMRVGDNRVREARRQKLRRDFEALSFKSSESVEDFALRLSNLLAELQLLGDSTTELDVVRKMLCVVPQGSSSGYKGGPKPKPAGGGSGEKKKGGDNAPAGGSNAAPRRNGNCRYCGKAGHWAKECRKAQRDREKKKQESANLIQQEDEQQGGLLMAIVDEIVAPQAVFLNEEKVIPVPSPDGVWFFDTGASSHMTGERHMFSTLDETVHGTVKFGDGSLVDIRGRGTVVFRSQGGEQRVLANVFYIPSLKSNIISPGQLDEGGCAIGIKSGVMTILDPGNRMLARVKRTGSRLYTGVLTIDAPACLLTQGSDVSWRWHARMGHLHFRALCAMASKQMAHGMPSIDHVDQYCDGCAPEKQHRAPFPHATAFRAEHGLDLVHTDLCGPITPASPSGNRYFLLVVDDHSRYMWLELLKTKDEAFQRFRKVQAMAEAEGKCRLRAFRSDRGGEFNSIEFREYCEDRGIKHYTTAPYSPQQNGVVERRNQTIVEMARCLLKSMGVPSYFWAEAVKTAVYILNRAPTRSLDGVTPYEAWHGRKPNVQHLRTFGCTMHVKKLGPGITKLSDRSTPMIFVGYEEGSKCYRAYDPATKKVQVTRDVLFDESRPWSWDMPNAHARHTGQCSDMDSARAAPTTFTVVYTAEDGSEELDTGGAAALTPTPSPVTPTQTPPPTPLAEPHTPDAARPVRWATPPTHDDACDADSSPIRYRRLSCILDETEGEAERDPFERCLLSAEEPRDVVEALGDAAWKKAMDEEMASILDNDTWVHCPLPSGHKAIGLRWVYKVKRDANGNVVKHKARLVAKGYAQRQGVDFEEVFAPVARMETVRLLLALAAHSSWEVHHMDVKSAFLNGDLCEEVYVAQPPGYIIAGKEQQVLKLQKALYGLRQAPRAWYAKLDDTLGKLGFTRSPLEHAVYRRGDSTSFLLVGVYVDDLIITGTNPAAIEEFKLQMKKLFRMSDLGLLSYYLGIEVSQTEEGITLCQRSYAAKILEMAGLSSCNSCSTPMECRLKLVKDDGETAFDTTLYRSIIGSLRYLVNSRPDIAHAVGIVSSDSDHAGDTGDRKSTSGQAFFLGDNIVTWTSQKQKIVAISSCEAEYLAAAAATCQGVWLSRLLGEMQGQRAEKFRLLVDNMSAIALAKNPVHHDRSKHIDVKFHFIREAMEAGEVEIIHVGTQEQLADLLTKALGRVRFIELRQKLGVLKISKPS